MFDRKEFDAAGEELRYQFLRGSISEDDYRELRQDRLNDLMDETGESPGFPTQQRFRAMLITREEMIANERLNS
jgi:hypothetical protein